MVLLRMDLKYLRLIRTIADEGNISRSADRLFLTQSALSHQLREIEGQLGFKVFLRSRNNWKLTEEGEELYRLAISVLSEIDESLDKIHEIRKGAKGQVRFSTECYSFYHGLPAFIQKMGLLYPEIDIQLLIEATHQPVSQLLSGELDISIVTTRPTQEALESLELFEDEVFALMHHEHPMAHQEHLSASDFEKLHLIIHSLPMETVSVHRYFLEPQRIKPAKLTTIPMTEVSLELVQANMGVMCMPQWALAAFKLPESIVFKRLGSNGLKRKHYLVYRAEDKAKKYIHDFIENIRDEFGD